MAGYDKREQKGKAPDELSFYHSRLTLKPKDETELHCIADNADTEHLSIKTKELLQRYDSNCMYPPEAIDRCDTVFRNWDDKGILKRAAAVYTIEKIIDYIN